MAFTILHLIDTTGPGGAEDVFVSIASNLDGDDIKSIAVIRGDGYVASSLKEKGVETLFIESKGSFNLKLVLTLLKLIKRRNVQLIQSHLLGSNVYAAIVGWIAKIPVVATYHGMVDVSPDEKFKSLKRWFLTRGVSRFVAVSRSLKDNIAELGLLDKDRTEVIYNGIDVDRYGKARTLELKKKLNINTGSPLFGSLGNVRQSKRYDLLIDAVAKLVARGVHADFCIAGDINGRLKQNLDSLIKRHNLKNIHFIGFVNDVPEYLNSIDVFLLTSDAEGFSIGTIEAMASALPIIATRCGGPEEIIENDQMGQLVDVSADSIAEAIENFIKNNVGDVNEVGKQRVHEHYSIKGMLQSYCDIYASLSTSFPSKFN